MKDKLFIGLSICLYAIAFLAVGCNKEDSLNLPEQTIVGKWMLTGGAETEENDIMTIIAWEEGRYMEYLPNRKIRYTYADGRINECDCTYRMDSEHLYVYYNRKEYGTDSDRIFKYSFNSDNNEHKLIYVKGFLDEGSPQYKVWFYKRITDQP